MDRLKSLYWRARHKKIPAYLHIPKTGGTYLTQWESDSRPVLSPMRYIGHYYVADHEEDLNPLYQGYDPDNARRTVIRKSELADNVVFATARNPFSWLVSYASHAGGWNPRYANTEHYDYANASRGFDYMLKVIANREDLWPNRKFIHCQLFSSGGDLIIDRLNRNETLDDDLAEMAASLKIRYRTRPRQRVGGLNDYRQYYTDALIDLVSVTWGRELRLFGYDFGSYNLDNAVMKKDISPEQKAKIVYSWKEDRLVIAGNRIPRENRIGAAEIGTCKE
ncbi:MAG: hypothetical protein FIA94_09720 [Nitrospirae bacterium]|nr:hypothetical protein [Nitrospirota bacterium]